MEQLTLEQATENAAGWQMQLDEALEELQRFSPSSPQWRHSLRKRNEAKQMLEWYYGYDEVDRHGNTIHHGGLIQKLAGAAQKLKEASNLGERFSNRTFGNFDPRRDSTAFLNCRDYANNDNLFR